MSRCVVRSATKSPRLAFLFFSVPRVSLECPKGVPDTLGTLSGHSEADPNNISWDTPSDTPVFWGGRSRDTSARETTVAGRGVRKPLALGG